MEHQDPVNRCMGRANPTAGPFRQLQHPIAILMPSALAMAAVPQHGKPPIRLDPQQQLSCLKELTGV
jgi:hypothetical protein